MDTPATPETPLPPPTGNKKWYVVKVQSGREESIKEAIERRVKIEGLEEFFGQIVIPVERTVTEMGKGKRVTRTRKLYPGYLMVEVEFNDRILYLFRETSGVGDFVGGGGVKHAAADAARARSSGCSARRRRASPRRRQVAQDRPAQGRPRQGQGRHLRRHGRRGQGDPRGQGPGPRRADDLRPAACRSSWNTGRSSTCNVESVACDATGEHLPVVASLTCTTLTRTRDYGRSSSRKASMAKQVTAQIKLQCPGGQATPAPPVGPALGQHGVNIGQFVKQFNDRPRTLQGHDRAGGHHRLLATAASSSSSRARRPPCCSSRPPASRIEKKKGGEVIPAEEKTKGRQVQGLQGHRGAGAGDRQEEARRPERPRPRTRRPHHRGHRPQHGPRRST